MVWLGFSYLDTFTSRIFLLRSFTMCFKVLHLQKEKTAVNNAYFMYLDQKVTSKLFKVSLHQFCWTKSKNNPICFSNPHFKIDNRTSLKHTSVISTNLNIQCVCPGSLFSEKQLNLHLFIMTKRKLKHVAWPREICRN